MTKQQNKFKAKFLDVLKKMDDKRSSELLSILMQEGGFGRDQLYTVYKENEHGYQQYQQFLQNHSIEFLGGTNSKVFKITPFGSDPYILKVEERFGQPREVENSLRKKLSERTYLPIIAQKEALCTKPNTKEILHRTFMITDYCSGGDLGSYRKQESMNDVDLALAATLNIYTQVGQSLEELESLGYALVDMKNSNLVIDANGFVRIMDMKSVLKLVSRAIDSEQLTEKGYLVISSEFVNPPELSVAIEDSVFPDDILANKIHAYLFGKNLYHYMSKCDDTYLLPQKDGDKLQHKDGAEFNYNMPIFQTAEGKILMTLIKQLVKPDPESRLSIKQALTKLEEVRLILEQRRAYQEKLAKRVKDCMNLLQNLREISQINGFDIDIGHYEKQVLEHKDNILKINAVRLEVERLIAPKTQALMLLNEIEENSSIIGDDIQMQVFVQEQKRKIVYEDKTDEELNGIIKELRRIKDDRVINAFLDLMKKYDKTSILPNFGPNKNRLKALKKAYIKVPVEERPQLMNAEEGAGLEVKNTLRVYQKGKALKFFNEKVAYLKLVYDIREDPMLGPKT